VKSIIETLTAQPRINRKDLADKILANVPSEELESAKLTLAADLHWLVREGYVIEFNDGSLDLPRVKKQPEQKETQKPAESEPEATLPIAETSGENVATEVAATAGTTPETPDTMVSTTPVEAEVGGS
jgi:hypothetical protein